MPKKYVKKKSWNQANKKIFKFEKYSHWIDYLSFWIPDKDYVVDFFTDRIFNLDDDNSNFWAVNFCDEILSINKYKSPTGFSYTFSVVFNSISIPIFVITEFSVSHSEFCGGQWGITHFYWAYYRLIELKHFSEIFINHINMIFYDTPISRIDYRFDFFHTKEQKIPTISEVFPNIRKNKKSREYSKNKQLQSWDIWNKANKTIFIRLYNKKDELNWNLKKTFLYWDIIDFKSFIRLEYEFWQKFCFWYTWKDIFLLIDKAFSTSWIEKSDFSWNLYKPKVVLDLSDEIQKLRYIKIFKSMAKNLKSNWINPFVLLSDYN